MKKEELLKYFDDDLLDKLFGFCYARTNDSYEAEELCSNIIFALVKSAHTEGEIEAVYPFIWRVARNVYADFSVERKRYTDTLYGGNAEDIISLIPDEEEDDKTIEQLETIYQRIAFLTRAYREVMVMYYIDGLSVTQIAKQQKTSEGAVRQRLFTARQKLKSEVKEMPKVYNKPIALDKINYTFIGTGRPSWGDPSVVCTRMFSKHIVWLCRKKPMSASEIAEELNVPTVYVEEELEILAKGENGKYGLLRRMDSGKYAINFILFDTSTTEKAHALYTEQLPKICDIISDYLEVHKEEYLSFPYLNKKIDWNLILWQQVFRVACSFSEQVKRILKEKHFADVETVNRPYSIFAYVDNGKYYGCGLDGAAAQNVCGFSNVHLSNIYIKRVKPHFRYGHNVSLDPQLQLTLRAIDGLELHCLSDTEKEHAAKAIECGYLYRERDTLYTKILVSPMSDLDKLFAITNKLSEGFFDKEAEIVADRLAELIKKEFPEYLHGEWCFANMLANLPVYDSVVENLIEKGILIPPENGIGAEGCWMSVEK